MSRPGDPFHAAAFAYLGYGVVYWVGGLYLISQGVGVAGGQTRGATGRTGSSAWPNRTSCSIPPMAR